VKILVQVVAALSACALLAIDGHGQVAGNYPARPVRMLIPFAPGGASDFVARIAQPKLGEELGQQIVIDNRAGAAGNIAVELVAHAAPDGYTILLGNIGAIAINPSVFPKFPINPLRDLASVTMIADLPGALAINGSLPVATVKEFIDYAKARPEKLNFGSAGASSSTRLMMEVFMSAAEIKLVHIPYKGGAGAATAALLSGEISASMASPASFVPHAKSGRLKVIGIVASRRIAALPDVPTFAELGYPELTVASWQGIYVPTATPRPVINRLFAAALKAMSDPWVIDRLAAGGAQPITSESPEDFARFTQSQTEFWARIVKKTGAAE
jgi:tripartite-type tricarboxylate transporter receptor subunit TctC